jgi:hypothetical protein
MAASARESWVTWRDGQRTAIELELEVPAPEQ